MARLQTTLKRSRHAAVAFHHTELSHHREAIRTRNLLCSIGASLHEGNESPQIDTRPRVRTLRIRVSGKGGVSGKAIDALFLHLEGASSPDVCIA